MNPVLLAGGVLVAGIFGWWAVVIVRAVRETMARGGGHDDDCPDCITEWGPDDPTTP